MPREIDEWLSQIKSIEREFRSARLGMDRFLADVMNDPTILKPDSRLHNLSGASRNLEGTYVIRLFAEFETGLRKYWASFRDTHPKAVHLIDGISSRRKIPHELTAGAHVVRESRNALVHERDDEVAAVTVGTARESLCRYLSRLPASWG